MLNLLTASRAQRCRAITIIGTLALVGSACSVEQDVAPPTAASVVTEEPSADSEPPATDPATTEDPTAAEPPATEEQVDADSDEAFCGASGDFWLPTEALDYIDDSNGAAAKQLFVDMGRLIDPPIAAAPSEAAAAPALQMKSVLRTLIPLLDEIGFDINRAGDASDVEALGDSLSEFGSIADQLEQFLTESCGFDPDELQSAAASYAAGVEGSAPATPATDPDGGTSAEPDSSGGAIESVSIEDASGTISVAVPATWTDVNPSPSDDFLSVQASASLPAFLGTFTEPGAFVEVYPSTNGTEDAAAGFDAVRESFVNTGCADSEPFDYDDGVYVGTEIVLDCAATTDLILIGGTNTIADMFFIVAMLVPDDDPRIRDLIASSFIVD